MEEPNILFVDDEPDIADYARAIFEPHGYRASFAPSGDLALVLLEEGLPFDLLITDVVLPGTLDGYALAIQARLHRPRIRVVYSTGFPQIAKVRARGTVFGDTLIKPWRPSDLLTLIAAVIREPSLCRDRSA